MDKYNNSKTRIIISIILSYLLIILKILFITPLFDNISDGRIHAILEFSLSFLCISVPITILYIKHNYRVVDLLLGIPIIFILVLIFSPEGWYFFIYKGNWFLTPAAENWEYGIYISIEFFIVQLIPVFILKSVQALSKPDSDEQNEKTDKK